MKKLLVLSILLLSISNLFAQTYEDNWNSYLKYFGHILADSLENNDATLFNTTFNEDLFIEKFIVRKDDKNIKAFNDDYIPELKANLNLGERLALECQGSYYDFVNSYVSNEEETHMIFRLIGKEGGINYHDFQVIRLDSSIQITDLYAYSTGQKTSEILGDIYRSLLKGMLDKKFHGAKKNEAQDAVLSLDKCKDLIEAMQYKSAMVEYMKIPEKFRQERIYMIWKIKIAEHLDDEQYIEAINEFNKLFPNDPSFYLYAFDKALVKEQYDDALKYLNKLDISVGLDPFLDYHRGLIYFVKEDYKQAEEKLEHFLNKFYWEDGTDLLLKTYLLTDQKTKASTLLNSYINELGYTKEGVAKWTKETHPEFSKSPEFLHWEKSE